MRNAYLLALTILLANIASCASKPPQPVGLEKYPQCYNINQKISQKCVQLNEAGEPTTALQLENAAYPGQYH
jgi:hypothetical protein